MSSAKIRRSLSAIQIRPLNGVADFTQAEQVQQQTWGFSDRDVVPAAIFSVAHHFGGQALGAFEAERMVGFALALGTVEQGHTHLHSHMVAVLPDFQDQGLGRLLKLAQREDALHRGISQIFWTFDPLQSRNAFLNIARLGGLGVRYLPNLYGQTSSPLHSGLPTDRLLIAWQLESPRVLRALSGEPPSPGAGAHFIPIATSAVGRVKSAAELQIMREEMMQMLSDGYTITGFERHKSVSKYVVEKLA